MTDRRTFLTAAGAAAVATGLAGCSAPNQVTPSAAAAVEVPATDVPVGGATILGNAKFVVTQPESGVYKAFNKACTHQGCPVTDVEGGDLICKCHGAKFSIVDGSVTRGPATRPLKAAKVSVEGDTLKITE